VGGGAEGLIFIRRVSLSHDDAVVLTATRLKLIATRQIVDLMSEQVV
jgi:hypothetical protein